MLLDLREHVLQRVRVVGLVAHAWRRAPSRSASPTLTRPPAPRSPARPHGCAAAGDGACGWPRSSPWRAPAPAPPFFGRRAATRRPQPLSTASLSACMAVRLCSRSMKSTASWLLLGLLPSFVASPPPRWTRLLPCRRLLAEGELPRPPCASPPFFFLLRACAARRHAPAAEAEDDGRSMTALRPRRVRRRSPRLRGLT